MTPAIDQNTVKKFTSDFKLGLPAENERPANKLCKKCGILISPILLPTAPFLGGGPRWVIGGDVCRKCLEEIERDQKLKEAYTQSGIPPLFREVSFEKFVLNPKNERAYGISKSYQANQKEGILFYGPPGTGKTHLAVSIANQLMSKTKLRFISCPEFLMETRKSFSSKGHNFLDFVKDVPLLIIDDIGSEKPTEWVQETIFVLIDHRMNFKLPTIFTTNCSMDDLSEKLGERTSSRIIGTCRLVRIDGEDYRVKTRLEKTK